MSVCVEDLLNRYKNGGCVHLGSPLDCEKTPDEIEEIRALEKQLIDAVYNYEIQQGNITIVNGLFNYGPGVLERLPRYRDECNMFCCIEQNPQ